MPSQMMQAVSIMFLWVMALSAIQFAATTIFSLTPLMIAGVRTLRWGMNRHDRMRELVFAMDQIQFRFSAAICTPWSIPLLMFGLAMIGIAISLLNTGDVMILVARQPDRWINKNVYLDWIASMLGGLGFAATLSAISRRRTVSFLISTGFAITGLGIGIIAAVYV